jgi:hypothetical protein
MTPRQVEQLTEGEYVAFRRYMEEYAREMRRRNRR